MGERMTCPACHLALPRSGVCGEPACDRFGASDA